MKYESRSTGNRRVCVLGTQLLTMEVDVSSGSVFDP